MAVAMWIASARELQTVEVARLVEDRILRRLAHVLLTGGLEAVSLRFLAGKQALDGRTVCYLNAWDAVHPGRPCGTSVSSNPVASDYWPYQHIDHILMGCGDGGGPTLRITGCELAFD